jgi:membrane protein DedA with SNARE-associated domain
VWNTVLVVAGYQLGAHWESVAAAVGGASKVVLIGGVAALAIMLAVRSWRRARA